MRRQENDYEMGLVHGFVAMMFVAMLLVVLFVKQADKASAAAYAAGKGACNVSTQK